MTYKILILWVFVVALASIGAVSNLKVISRSENESNGWLVINNGVKYQTN